MLKAATAHDRHAEQDRSTSGSEKVGKRDVLVKLTNDQRKWPPRNLHRQSANIQQLAKLEEVKKEAGVSGGCNSKCTGKLCTDVSEEGIDMAFLYQCGQSQGPNGLYVTHPNKSRESACSEGESRFGSTPQV